MANPQTMHEALGGDAFFGRLVERFYDGVAGDARLRPLYPDDLSESRRTLTGFLIQYWGGSTAYSDERGHPRLRMRHAPFAIGRIERDAWFEHMSAAVDAEGLSEELRAPLLGYFEQAATAMINQPVI